MKIFTTPMGIPDMHKLWHYMKYLNVGTTNNIENADLIIHYNYTQDAVFPLPDILKDKDCVNKYITNIRKDFIETIFEKVFGYTSFINPLTYKSCCVEKGVRNAVHNGKILQCPISLNEVKSNNIYQRLIDNRIGLTRLRDIRVVIMKDEIPAIFTKEFNTDQTFTHGLSNTEGKLLDPDKLLSKEEITKILTFTNMLKLDYGELDVLRSNETEKLYIVDVNPTPGQNLLFLVKGSREIMAEHFNRVFLS